MEHPFTAEKPVGYERAEARCRSAAPDPEERPDLVCHEEAMLGGELQNPDVALR
jgi:hypothetical protein